MKLFPVFLTLAWALSSPGQDSLSPANEFAPLGVEDLQPVIEAGQRTLQELYLKRVEYGKTFHGSIVFTVTVAASGKVSKVAVKKSTLENPEFQKAVVKEIKSWVFRKSPEGATFDLPFSFEKQPDTYIEKLEQ